MAWQERTQERTRTSRTYADGSLRRWSGTMAALHYESVLDSGVYDTEIDCTPVRIDNAQLDGWRVTANGLNYYLGQPASKLTDGWVGVGGRQGAHWFAWRLVRAAYWHSTGGLDEITGAPNYDRANLSRSTSTLTIGPNADTVNAASVAEWRSIWAPPGGGELYARWLMHGDGLKEELVLNAAARTWLTANRPPTTPATETWFGFVSSLDWSDIPAVYRGEVLQDIDVAFDDADGTLPITLKDSLNRVLAVMPAGRAYVETASGRVTLPLKRRFYRVNGSYYLLIGALVSDLNQLPAGDIVFDPTVDEGITAWQDNITQEDGSGVDYWWLQNGNNGTHYWDIGLRFQTVAIPNGATISSADVTLTCYAAWCYDTPAFTITGDDVDDSANFSSSYPSARTDTTASVSWGPTNPSAEDERTTADIASIIQEIVNRGGWSSGNDLSILIDDNGSTSTEIVWYDVTDSATKCAQLSVTYSTAIEITVGVGALSAAGQSASVTPGAVSITCGTGDLTGAGVSASVTPGATSVTVGAGSLAAAGPAASIDAVVSIVCGTGALTGAGVSANVMPGAVQVALGTGALVGAGPAAAIDAVVSIACGTGALVGAGQNASVIPGAVSITCGTGDLTGSGASASVTPGAVSIATGTGALIATGQGASVTPGAVSITCGTGDLTGAGVSASVTPGAIELALSAGALTSGGQGADVQPGAVTVSAGVGALAASGYTAHALVDNSQVVGISAGALAGAGQAGSVVVSVDIACSAGVLSAAGQDVTVSVEALARGVSLSFSAIGGVTMAWADLGDVAAAVSEIGAATLAVSDTGDVATAVSTLGSADIEVSEA